MSTEEAAAARKIRGSPRVSALTEFMADPEGLGLWEQNVQAAAFLAAYAVLAGKTPAPTSAKGPKLVEIGNFYSLPQDEKSAFWLAAKDAPSLDAALIDAFPGLMEAGAEALEPTLRGPDPLPKLVQLLAKALARSAKETA